MASRVDKMHKFIQMERESGIWSVLSRVSQTLLDTVDLREQMQYFYTWVYL